MNAEARIITSNGDLGLVNVQHSETSHERTLVRREKLANELIGGAINDLLQALSNDDCTRIGNLINKPLLRLNINLHF